MDKKAKLMSLIELFEMGQADYEQLQLAVNELTGKTISLEEVEGYSGYTSLDNFCETFLVEPTADWQDMEDTTAIQMITQILDDVTIDAIMLKNGEALEKRYRKPAGFVSKLVFHSALESPDEILQELKKDTSIYL